MADVNYKGLLLLVLVLVLVGANALLVNKIQKLTSGNTSTVIMGDEDVLMGMHPYETYTINVYDGGDLDVVEFTTRSGRDCIVVSYRRSWELALQCDEKNNGDE